jgi:tyrosine-protein phosphatase YwqE
MAVDITKVFRANVKAIRMSSSDGTNTTQILEEELFRNKAKTDQSSSQAESFSKNARQIVTSNVLFIRKVKNNKNDYKRLKT